MSCAMTGQANFKCCEKRPRLSVFLFLREEIASHTSSSDINTPLILLTESFDLIEASIALQCSGEWVFRRLLKLQAKIFATSEESVQPSTTDARDVDPHLRFLAALSR